MHRDARANSKQPIDPDAVADIASKVLARLAALADQDDAATIDDRVVTVDTLLQLPKNPKQLSIRPDAVVTPAARDEARRRGITIGPHNEVPGQQSTNPSSAAIIDTDKPERAAAVRQQLAARGIDFAAARIVLSDTPAREVWQQCSAHGERAVMVTTTGDVARLADELNPTLWVLDMHRLNLVAAVNTIAAITRTGSRQR